MQSTCAFRLNQENKLKQKIILQGKTQSQQLAEAMNPEELHTMWEQAPVTTLRNFAHLLSDEDFDTSCKTQIWTVLKHAGERMSKTQHQETSRINGPMLLAMLPSKMPDGLLIELCNRRHKRVRTKLRTPQGTQLARQLLPVIEQLKRPLRHEVMQALAAAI